MKLKVLALTLLLLYLSGTAGVAISLHFCGKKISGIRVNSSKKAACCGKDAETPAMKCCKDKHLNIKVSDEHASAAQLKLPQSPLVLLLPHFSVYTRPVPVRMALIAPTGERGPPRAASSSLLIKNQVFRI